jgi:putative ABC transport system permease protein
VREALATAAAGACVGIAAGIAFARIAGSALLRVPAVDARAVAAIAAVTGCITIAAVLVPARRAARVDVVELLRSQ